MSMSVNINPAQTVIEAVRTLRSSGNSTILTIPPEVLQALDLSPGDDLRLQADWSNNQITVEPAD